MNKKHLLITAVALVLLSVVLMSCSKGNDNNDSSSANVKIAIAWRADTDNEFCTNVANAFREAGVEVVVLPQVKAEYLGYDGDAVSASCLDPDGIGYLSNASGSLVRSNTYQNSNAAAILDGVQGVLFTGGEDISPSLYATQEDWHHITEEIDYNAARDVSDYLTMAYCLDHNIPLLGFCRGAQMLGVVSGATMIQDLPTWFAAQGLPYQYEHRRQKAAGETYRDYTPHDVRIDQGSVLSRLFGGCTSLSGCPSWHHQAILSVDGTPLRASATTTVSGVANIEGIERTDKQCAVAIQFHPEAAVVKHIGKGVNNANAAQFMSYDAAMPIFRAFVEQCR